eukprot:9227792-Ditylum_brightwellii.AAC.1
MKRARKTKQFFSQAKRLYGHNEHLATIMDTYRKIAKSEQLPKMIVVSGYAGIGEAFLVVHVQNL